MISDSELDMVGTRMDDLSIRETSDLLVSTQRSLFYIEKDQKKYIQREANLWVKNRFVHAKGEWADCFTVIGRQQ